MKKTALITGASGGIGYELAKMHAKNRENLVLIARSQDKLQNIKQELESSYKTDVQILVKDLSQKNAPEEIFDDLQKSKIHITYLINNAGLGDFGYFHESDWEKQSKMIDLNMHSLTHLTRLFLPSMVKKKYGRIMNVASTASFQPGPLMSVYYATKHYVLAFSEAISNELKGTGVTVTALCPGPTKSGFQDAAELNGSKLFKNLSVASSEDVARYGYNAMKSGKTVAVHGFINRLMARSVSMVPRPIARNMVRKMQDKNH
jgi:hypothetical protein